MTKASSRLFGLTKKYKKHIDRGVHGSGWVELRRFFDLTHHGGSKKIQPNPTHHINPTQPNPTHMGLTNFIIIIIKLSRKKYKY